MKKLLFVLCLIGAFEVISLAQSSVSNPVNNVWRQIWLPSYPSGQTNVVFTHFNDFLGGYDISLLGTSGEILNSYFSLDFSTTQMDNLNVSMEANSDYTLLEVNVYGTWWSVGNGEDFKNGILPQQYTETPFNVTGKTSYLSVSLTNDCIPLTDESFVEVWVMLDIVLPDEGGYSSLGVTYDFTMSSSFGIEN